MGLDHKTIKFIMSISNLISALNNAIKANKTCTYHKASKQNIDFLKVMVKNNFIYGYSLHSSKTVKIFVYPRRKNPFLHLSSLSKPSFPIYLSHKDLWKFDKTLSLIILTTSKGFITHKTALSKGLGGKALALLV